MDVEVDYPRLYWLSFAVAGLVTLLRAVVMGLSQVTLQTLVLLVVGMVVLGTAVRGLKDPAASGAPTEPTPLLVVAVLAATVYSLFTLATIL
ncbi:hypothetical protein [Salinigranum halophilum]|jgi:hypothetical protein|uniref:hypothetical protein n=1 Tax=Salinigranum halophilum TaxID=2565931 RepID=UPI0010A77E9B|nr:hypothetical protein [Salinigranum halophilum]